MHVILCQIASSWINMVVPLRTITLKNIELQGILVTGKYLSYNGFHSYVCSADQKKGTYVSTAIICYRNIKSTFCVFNYSDELPPPHPPHAHTHIDIHCVSFRDIDMWKVSINLKTRTSAFLLMVYYIAADDRRERGTLPSTAMLLIYFPWCSLKLPITYKGPS